MQQKPKARLIKGMFALGFLGMICGLPLAVIGYLGVVEHNRRVKVLETGEVAVGYVLESSQINSRGCAFKYRFKFAGHLYEGGEGGCGLVANHRAGSELIVRFSRNDPENSVAVGADIWPGWVAVPILIGLGLLILGGVCAYAIFKGARRSPRRRNKSLS